MIIYYTDRFAGGRAESRRLLKEALTVYTGDEKQAKTLIGELKKGEYGKPYIEGFSCFSISHTGSIWAVLFADRECGLDIQTERKCDIMAIAKRFFAPGDAAVIVSLTNDESGGNDLESQEYSAKVRDTFFRVWTRREALVKALGGSVADSDLPAVLTGNTEVGGKKYSITDIELPYIRQLYAAMCFEGDDQDIELRICQI